MRKKEVIKELAVLNSSIRKQMFDFMKKTGTILSMGDGMTATCYDEKNKAVSMHIEIDFRVYGKMDLQNCTLTEDPTLLKTWPGCIISTRKNKEHK